ncbi:MAG: hypothetical protein KatS3mg129_1336 [Leptospiraceae bacterium]|nr:MAG: hypothetical protein KatS3mg129_1336 [Leptospiraceae bacterium]
MEVTKQIGSKIITTLKNQSKQTQIFVLIFFIIGILLILSNYFIKNDPSQTQEQSGLLGYYLYFILFQLFGISSNFAGPLLVIFSIKSFFSSDLKYLKNGLLGLTLFLFSFSSLLAIFDYNQCGFAGEQLTILGTYLLGKIGFLIFTIIIFIISNFYMFSLKLKDIINFFKNKKEKKINLFELLIKLMPLLVVFFQSKKFRFWNKKNKAISISTDNNGESIFKKTRIYGISKKYIQK